MQINPISNTQNINSKAKISLIADKNSLPKNSVKQLVEKVKTIGRSDDMINLCIYRRLHSQNSGETVIKAGRLDSVTSYLTDYTEITIKGSFTECKKKTLNTINDYLDNLKKKYEKFKSK